jgi:hypothetical protein
MLAFGYTDGLPAGTDTAWGCQATITPTGTISVAEERTDLMGPRAAQLRDHLQQHVGAVWRDRAREALRAAVLRPGHAAQVVLYRDAIVVIKAATQASDGDLHVCAYLLGPSRP